METSIFIARVVGPVFIIVSLGLMFNAPGYRTMLQNISKDPLSLYLSGMFASVMGLLLLMSTNTFVILTLMGYAALLKGATILLFPDWTVQLVQKMDLSENLLRIAGLFCFALGLYVSFLGFI